MILTLALGIGVNTAISSVVRSILVDPWPYDDPQELIALRGNFPTNPTTWVAYREVEACSPPVPSASWRVSSTPPSPTNGRPGSA